MNSRGKFIEAVKSRKKQCVVVDGKRCFIVSKETGSSVQPVKITVTTEVREESAADAKRRLARLSTQLDELFIGEKAPFPSSRWRAFIGGDSGFAEKVSGMALHCAMFWGVERRDRWSNY